MPTATPPFSGLTQQERRAKLGGFASRTCSRGHVVDGGNCFVTTLGQTRCRICMRASVNARFRQRKNRLKEFIDSHRRGPCSDCGGTFDLVCMDFHHRDPATKVFHVSEAASKRKNELDILVEIQKCDLVCANCHRLRHQAERRIA